MRQLKLYLALLPVFFLVDMLWLGVIAADFYQAQIGHLLSPRGIDHRFGRAPRDAERPPLLPRWSVGASAPARAGWPAR
jgi:hypothetical protein